MPVIVNGKRIDGTLVYIKHILVDSPRYTPNGPAIASTVFDPDLREPFGAEALVLNNDSHLKQGIIAVEYTDENRRTRAALAHIDDIVIPKKGKGKRNV